MQSKKLQPYYSAFDVPKKLNHIEELQEQSKQISAFWLYRESGATPSFTMLLMKAISYYSTSILMDKFFTYGLLEKMRME